MERYLDMDALCLDISFFQVNILFLQSINDRKKERKRKKKENKKAGENNH